MSQIVQAQGGRNKGSPYGVPGLYCNQPDATAWRAQVDHVHKLVEDAARAVPPAQRTWAAQYANYMSEYAALPGSDVWPFTAGCTQAVAAYIANLEAAACLLDLIQRSGSGITVPDSPEVKPPLSDLTSGIAWAIPAAILVGVLAFASRGDG